MGERVDGSWAATTVAEFGPRQSTGKTDNIAARELWGLLIAGEKLQIHTAHEFPTANESFLRVVSVFEAWDDLRSKVKRVRYANGEQGIELLSGQRLKYKARTGGSGRGFTKADLVVYDEAQHLQVEHVAASGPARLANPNSQSWYAGSGGLAASKQAWMLRHRATKGDDGVPGRFAYVEHTAETVDVNESGRVRFLFDGEIESREHWYRANPGLGRWVTEDSLEGLRGEFGDAMFSRECLCVWEPCPDLDTDHDGVISEAAWSALVDPASKIVTSRCFGLDVSPDYRWSSLGAAGRRADGLLHVEAFDTRPDTDWLVQAACDLFAKWQLPIRIQKGSPAAAFIGDLRARGVVVVEMSAQEHAAAVGQMLTAVQNRTVRHLGALPLNAAARNADVRPVGDVELWARRQARGNITPIVAVTLALGGVAAAADDSYTPRRLR